MRQKVSYLRGFTLLEMLISVAVFAMMSAIAYSGLSQVIRSSEQITLSNKTLSELQFSLSVLEKDMLQLTSRKIRNEYGDEQPSLKIAQDKLTLSRLGWFNFIGAQRSQIQRVEYVLIEEQLVRRYWLTLDLASEQKPIESVLMSGIRALSFHVINSHGDIKSAWPNDLGDQSKLSAKAIEIIIELDGWGEIKKIFELTDEVA